MNSAQFMHNLHYFWFGDLSVSSACPSEESTKLWFGFSPEVDTQITDEYSDSLEAATKGQLDEWKESSQGIVSLIVLLDQFSRQIYRKTENAFAYDTKALEIAQEAVAKQMDRNMHFAEKVFCYLPFEHSEDVNMQRKCVALYSKLLKRASEPQHEFASTCLKMAREHLAIIERFGRFPHRNEVLGRASNEQEIKYLAEQNEHFGQ